MQDRCTPNLRTAAAAAAQLRPAPPTAAAVANSARLYTALPKAKNTVVELLKGVDLLRGFCTAMRPMIGPTPAGRSGPAAAMLALNVDMACSVFRTPEPAINLVYRAAFDGAELDKLQGPQILEGLCRDSRRLHAADRAIKGVKVETCMTRRETKQKQKRTYVIKGVANVCAGREVIRDLNKTVQQYLEETYDVKLQHPFAPMLWAKSKDNPTYLPLELCTVIRMQPLRRIPPAAAMKMPSEAGAGPAARVAGAA